MELRGVLVTINQARANPEGSWGKNESSKPYVEVIVNGETKRTKTLEGHNPQFEETFNFKVNQNDSILLKLWNDVRLMTDTLYGEHTIPLNQFPIQPVPVRQPIPLRNSSGEVTGELFITIQGEFDGLRPLNRIGVVVSQARPTPNSVWGSTANPNAYIEVAVGKEKQSTKPLTGLNPIWEQLFEFPAAITDEVILSLRNDAKLALDPVWGTLHIRLGQFPLHQGILRQGFPFKDDKGNVVGEVLLVLVPQFEGGPPISAQLPRPSVSGPPPATVVTDSPITVVGGPPQVGGALKKIFVTVAQGRPTGPDTPWAKCEKPNAYIEVTVGGKTQKTDSLPGHNPLWEKRLEFNATTQDQLTFKLWNNIALATDPNWGTFSVPLINLPLPRGPFQEGFPLRDESGNVGAEILVRIESEFEGQPAINIQPNIPATVVAPITVVPDALPPRQPSAIPATIVGPPLKQIQVTILQGNALQGTAWALKDSPNVYVELIVGSTKKQTKRINSHTPNWNETFTVPATYNDSLVLKIWQDISLGGDVNYGVISLPLAELPLSQGLFKQVFPARTDKGDIGGDLSIVIEPQFEGQPASVAQAIIENLGTPLTKVNVLVSRVRALPNTQWAADANSRPYVEVLLGKHTKRTKTIEKSHEPIFEEKFEFLESNINDTLTLKIWNDVKLAADPLFGSAIIKLNQLPLQAPVNQTVVFLDSNSKPIAEGLVTIEGVFAGVQPQTSVTSTPSTGGNLLIRVHQARPVPSSLWARTQNPRLYIEIKVANKSTHKTKVLDGLAPVWSESFDVKADINDEVVFNLWNDVKLAADPLLGSINIRIADLPLSSGSVHRPFPLNDKSGISGELVLTFEGRFGTVGNAEVGVIGGNIIGGGIPSSPIPQTIVNPGLNTGIVYQGSVTSGPVLGAQKYTVTVINARGLPNTDGGWLSKANKTDAYVELKVGKEVKKTKTINDSLNPTWNESFVFQADPNSDLIFNVYDNDYLRDDFLGSATIRFSQVLGGFPRWISLNDKNGKHVAELQYRVDTQSTAVHGTGIFDGAPLAGGVFGTTTTNLGFGGGLAGVYDGAFGSNTFGSALGAGIVGGTVVGGYGLSGFGSGSPTFNAGFGGFGNAAFGSTYGGSPTFHSNISPLPAGFSPVKSGLRTYNITVVSARGVNAPGGWLNILESKPDTYVEVQLGNDKKRTKTITSTNPTWNETLSFTAEPSATEISFRVYDADFLRDDFLGFCFVNLAQISLPFSQTLAFQDRSGKNTGEVTVRIEEVAGGSPLDYGTTYGLTSFTVLISEAQLSQPVTESFVQLQVREQIVRTQSSIGHRWNERLRINAQQTDSIKVSALTSTGNQVLGEAEIPVSQLLRLYGEPYSLQLQDRNGSVSGNLILSASASPSAFPTVAPTYTGFPPAFASTLGTFNAPTFVSSGFTSTFGSFTPSLGTPFVSNAFPAPTYSAPIASSPTFTSTLGTAPTFTTLGTTAPTFTTTLGTTAPTFTSPALTFGSTSLATPLTTSTLGVPITTSAPITTSFSSFGSGLTYPAITSTPSSLTNFTSLSFPTTSYPTISTVGSTLPAYPSIGSTFSSFPTTLQSSFSHLTTPSISSFPSFASSTNFSLPSYPAIQAPSTFTNWSSYPTTALSTPLSSFGSYPTLQTPTFSPLPIASPTYPTLSSPNFSRYPSQFSPRRVLTSWERK